MLKMWSHDMNQLQHGSYGHSKIFKNCIYSLYRKVALIEPWVKTKKL
jgi:hypothetical protein